MKNILFALALIVTMPIIAQQEPHRSVVHVTGEGIVNVEPDEVLIKSRIEHEGSTAAQVKKENDEVVAQVIKYLKSQNISEKDIQTDYMNLNKRYDYNEKTYSYVANQAISITLHDIGKYEKIMRGLLENGLNRIDGIQFKSSEMEKYEQEARKKAVLDAQNIARQLAEPLGQTIGRAITISETDYNSFQPIYKMDAAMQEMNMSNEGGQTIAPGELEIKIKVSIGFELK
ncbi:SIMPL domain-containing protein [Christiangramia sabulilitoris]|uniref:DUF541 domain-containing protein n=1 Tax=Christiangramia sabulilitoris TaxID=2583991 RepID=A0A550I2C4_9FLAO|nr:SIMPL domain-containing protein [Christiangramia sabulilitoris]TRO65132.1 DUF541 domain-containing protein [Christiangramia sabulilitoris]